MKSNYIKEWLFCESGNAYKLSEIVEIVTSQYKDTVAQRCFWIRYEGTEQRQLLGVATLQNPVGDYIEIINALKEREQSIFELLLTEDKDDE